MICERISAGIQRVEDALRPSNPAAFDVAHRFPCRQLSWYLPQKLLCGPHATPDLLRDRAALLTLKRVDALDHPVVAGWALRVRAQWREPVAGRPMVIAVPGAEETDVSRERGVRLVAAQVAKVLGIECGNSYFRRAQGIPRSLVRPRLDRSVHFRSIGVDGAVAGRDILLLDDVRTTGTTIDCCAAMLFTAGARSIQAIALTQTMPWRGPHE